VNLWYQYQYLNHLQYQLMMSMGIGIERPYIHHLGKERVKCRDMHELDMQIMMSHMRNRDIEHPLEADISWQEHIV
jgi:hypothetical protein